MGLNQAHNDFDFWPEAIELQNQICLAASIFQCRINISRRVFILPPGEDPLSKSKPAFLAFIFGLSAALLTFAQTPPSHPAATHPGSTPHASPATLSEARQTSVVKYIRERFGVAGNVKLTFGEIKQSNVSPAYLDSILTISDGTNSHQQEILVFEGWPVPDRRDRRGD